MANIRKRITAFSLPTLSIISLMATAAQADTVSLDKIFSGEVYIGAIPCSHVQWSSSDYTNTAEVFTNTMLSDSLGMQPIENICVQGGGDCDCYIPFTAKRSIDAKRASYEVRTTAQEKVWVAAPTRSHFMLELAIRGKHGEGVSPAELQLRSPAPAIFGEMELKTRVDPTALLAIPADVLQKFPLNADKTQLLFSARGSLTLKGKTYVQLSVDAILDENSFSCADAPENFVPHTEHVRDIWVEAYDEKGRITFWLTAPPPC